MLTFGKKNSCIDKIFRKLAVYTIYRKFVVEQIFRIEYKYLKTLTSKYMFNQYLGVI